MPPVGPTGLPESCSGEEPGAERRDFRVFASAGWADSRLLFSDPATFQETTVAAGIAWRVSPRVTLHGSLGALATGGLEAARSGTEKMAPGALGALGASFQILDGTGGWPFSTVSAIASGLAAHTVDAAGAGAAFLALDFRATAIIGYTLWGRFSPYVGVSLFGGPVYWAVEAEVAGDAYHYQVLGGASLALPAGFDLFVEGSPLGERSLSGGVGLRF